MKKTLLILLIIFSFSANAQTVNYDMRIDSLKNEITTIKLNNNYVQKCLENCHKEYNTGTTFIVGGILFTGFGIAISEGEKVPDAFWIIGTALTTVGVIFQIDSHKWIKKAGGH